MNIGKYWEFPEGTLEVTRDQIYQALALEDEPTKPYGLFIIWAYSSSATGEPAILEVQNQGDYRVIATNPCMFPEVPSTSKGVLIPTVASTDASAPYNPYTKTMGHNDKFFVNSGSILCVYYLNLEEEVI